MTHWPTHWRDISYRLFLLRRLTLVCAAMLMAGVVIGQPGMAMPDLVAALLVCLALPAAHNTLFPGGWVDALAFSVAGGVCAALWSVWLGDLTLVAQLAAFWVVSICVTGGIGLLNGAFPLGDKVLDLRGQLNVPADRAAAVLPYRPGSETTARKVGYPDRHGLLPVWMGARFADPETGLALPSHAEKAAGPADYLVRGVDEGPLWQQPLHVLPQGPFSTPAMTGSSSPAMTELTPLTEFSCAYRSVEMVDSWDQLTRLAWWLTDAHRDYLREAEDIAAGRPTVAVRSLPQITLLVMVARAFAALDMGQPSRG